MKRCSQTLQSLSRRVFKMSDFSGVGVNAMLKNQHAHTKGSKRNPFHSNYWPWSFLGLGIPWEEWPEGE